MNEEKILALLENIIAILKSHRREHNNHSSDCDFFEDKYLSLKNAIINNNSEERKNLSSWNKLYAPRIIYEGIGNKSLLIAVEKLNHLLSS
jgi:hypothetical protein